MDQPQNMTGAKCPCPHHKMVPIFIILIGLSFLLTACNVLTDKANSYIWPILLIAIGGQKLFQNRCNCCSKDH